MNKFEKDMFYVTELTHLNRLSFSDLNSVNMVYEKTLFNNPPTAEKIIIILQYMGDNTFKEMLTNIQVKMEPNHEMSETILRGCDFEVSYKNYEGTVLFVKSDNLKQVTEMDRLNFSKMNQTNFKQLVIKIDRIAKKQFLDEIKAANMYSDEYVILTAGEEIFGDLSQKKNSY